MHFLTTTLRILLKKSKSGLIVLFILTLISASSYTLIKDTLLQGAQSLGESLARNYANEEQSNLVTYETLLAFGVSTINDLYHENATEDDKKRRLLIYFNRLTKTLPPNVVDPYVVTKNGIIALNPWEGNATYDFGSTPWFKLANSFPENFVFTDIYEDAITKKPVFTLAKKCDNGDIMAFDISSEAISKTQKNLELPTGGSLFLCDRQGVIIRSQIGYVGPKDKIQAYVSNIFTLIQDNKLKSYDSSIIDINNQKRGVYYYTLSNGWTAIITIPFSTILKNLQSFEYAFLLIIIIIFFITGILLWRNAKSWYIIERTNEAVRVLGNSFYAIYRINLINNTYEMIKGSDDIRNKLQQHTGPYDKLLEAMLEVIKPDLRDEFKSTFSSQKIYSLVAHRVKNFGGDFLRQFGKEYHWVSIHVLFDESLSSNEAVLCFKRVDQEKQKEFKERQLLEAALEKAKQSQKSKQAFFNSMSHEMRTPLNAIINLVTLAEKAPNDNDKILSYLKKIKLSGSHMLHLINDILDFSRLEYGKRDTNIDSIDLDVCIQEIIDPFILQAEQSEKKFKYSFNAENKIIMADKFSITQVFNNLLSNALKFTSKGDTISVTVSQLPKQQEHQLQYKFILSDTGKGISPEFINKLFDPYTRDQRYSSQIAGTGLGMPIVKNIIELLDGQIYVESELEKGTTFTIIIPFLPGTLKSIDQDKANTTVNQLVAFTLEGKRVLVAEDNEINMEIADEMLSLNGIIVERAWNGQEAFEKFKASDDYYYDAILMDMQMPEMDGCEAARHIRALNKADAQTIPIIAVTANAFSEDIVATIKAGMNAHISKPIDFQMLYKVLEKYLSQPN